MLPAIMQVFRWILVKISQRRANVQVKFALLAHLPILAVIDLQFCSSFPGWIGFLPKDMHFCLSLGHGGSGFGELDGVYMTRGAGKRPGGAAAPIYIRKSEG
ncbi:Uncharacterised protein [Chlamydia abortus]|nr:Uncharacterised protein [Chlamydia abortus]